ncbi:CaMK family protein kinase, partial [Plakobranchus ocellatus]
INVLLQDTLTFLKPGLNEKVSFDTSPGFEKHGTSEREIIRQDSSEIIDKRQNGKFLPPEIGPSEASLDIVDFRTAWQLGVNKKFPQKRPWVEDGVQQADEAVHRNHLLTKHVKASKSHPVSISQHNHARKKDEAWRLMNDINNSSNQQLPMVKRVMFDSNLAWEDLVVDKREKRLVGKGSFGLVKRFKNKKGGKVIEKILLKNKSPQAWIQANEIMVPLEFVNSAMIPSVLALSWNGEQACIYQEDAGPSLKELIENPSFLWHLQQPGQIMKIALGLFKAILLLHMHGIKHRDVKPENFCYDQKTGQVRLIDFGSSRTSQDETGDVPAKDHSYSGTTPEYLPVIENRCLLTKKYKPLTEKSDVWAVAMVVLFLIKKGHPVIKFFIDRTDYPADLSEEKLLDLRMVKVLLELAKLNDPLPGFFLHHPGLPEIEGLLQGCLRVNEEQRWTAQRAVAYISDQLNQDTPKQKRSRLDHAGKMKAEVALRKASDDVQKVCNQDLTKEFGVIPRSKLLIQADTRCPRQIAPKPPVAAACPSAQIWSRPTQPVAPAASHWHVGSPSNDKEDYSMLMHRFGATASSDVALNREQVRPGPSDQSPYLFSGKPYSSFGFLPQSGNGSNSNFDFKALVSSSANPKSLVQKMTKKVMPPSPDPPAQCMGIWGDVNPLKDQVKGKVVLPDDQDELLANIPIFLR